MPEFRMIGSASEENKNKVKEDLNKALFEQFESMSPEDRDRLAELEYPKSEKELKLIDFTNIETSKLMEEAGIEPYDIPPENYHIIPPELFNKISRPIANATTSYNNQGIVFNAKYFRNNPVYFGSVALHEALHLKAHFTMQVEEKDGGVKRTPYRKGVSVSALQRHGSRGEYHEHFAGLHEAIVTETQKRYLRKLLDLPDLEKEKEWLTSEVAIEERRKLAEKKGISEDEIIWIGEKGKDDYELLTYPAQRQVLNFVYTEIQKEFPDQYKNIDDIHKVFLKAHFTGQLLPIARLVEKTFGEGSFRLLGNMDTDQASGVLHLESLKKARMRHIKKETSR